MLLREHSSWRFDSWREIMSGLNNLLWTRLPFSSTYLNSVWHRVSRWPARSLQRLESLSVQLHLYQQHVDIAKSAKVWREKLHNTTYERKKLISSTFRTIPCDWPLFSNIMMTPTSPGRSWGWNLSISRAVNSSRHCVSSSRAVGWSSYRMRLVKVSATSDWDGTVMSDRVNVQHLLNVKPWDLWTCWLVLTKHWACNKAVWMMIQDQQRTGRKGWDHNCASLPVRRICQEQLRFIGTRSFIISTTYDKKLISFKNYTSGIQH